MTQDEAIQRLCKLTEEVMDHVGARHASDCFCGKGGMHGLASYGPEHYQNDGFIVEWIEASVRDRIEREKEELRAALANIPECLRGIEWTPEQIEQIRAQVASRKPFEANRIRREGMVGTGKGWMEA